MKPIRYSFFSIILIASVSLLSCSKKTTIDPNQLLIPRMNAVTDSSVANTLVPGIVALAVDNKHGINCLHTSGVIIKQLTASTVIIYFNCLLEAQPDYLFNSFIDILPEVD